MLAVILPAVALAQSYNFKYYGPEEGLKNLGVHCLYQDKTGFIWVGTSNGLFRYDGFQFKLFGSHDGLPSARIRALSQTPDGTLWIGTATGLARMKDGRIEAIQLGFPHEVLTPASIALGRDGQLYVATNQRLVAGSPSGANSAYTFESAANGTIYSVHVDPEGAVWFGRGLELCRIRSRRTTCLGSAEGVPADRWEAILTDAEGNLWIRSARRLLVRMSGGQKFSPRDQGLPHASNTAAMALAKGTGVLVPTDLGLARQNGGKWEVVGLARGLQTEAVSTALEDQEGSVWLGLWGNGVARWLGHSQWASWRRADGLNNEIVWALAREHSGTLWIGTDNGLHRMPDGEVRRPDRCWTDRNGLSGNKVKSIALAGDGTVWVGLNPGGIDQLDPRTGRVRRFGGAAGLTDERVISIFLDRESRLWASTIGGLFRSTPVSGSVRFEKQSVPDGGGPEDFGRFLPDRDGGLWLSSLRGLLKWTEGRWKRFTSRDGLKRNAVSHLAQAPDGGLWVSYREAVGVSRITFDGGGIRVQNFTRNDGLASDYTLFLGFDTGGRLWVGSDDGVAVREEGRWRKFTRADGLVWDACAASAFLADPDGSVWLGTLRGLSRHRPAPEQPLKAPAVAITTAWFGRSERNPAEVLRIPYRDRSFHAEFASLSYRYEKAMRFRYRLTGLEDQWVETVQREARYSSLPAGTYTFEVAASNSAGEWGEKPAAISFTILAPWWQSWWFRLLIAFAVIAFGRWYLRRRMYRLVNEHARLEAAVEQRTTELQRQNAVVEKQKREIEELLEQTQQASRAKSEFLANMSHEIRTPMNGILGMTELALVSESAQEQRECIETAKESAETLLVLLNEILDFSKSEVVKLQLDPVPFSLKECIAGAVRTMGAAARQKGLSLASQLPEDAPAMLLGDPVRLRQILLNLIGNAIKFTDHGSVTVALKVEPSAGGESSMLHFSVRDTGIGISRDKQDVIFEPFSQADGSMTRKYGGTGLGLAISSRLVQLMDGRIWVESEPQRGSTFHFTVVLKRCAAGRDAEQAGEAVSNLPRLSCRVLLVEDNPVNRKVAERVLERAGHAVVTAANGREALATLGSETFDLILMDVQMPEMDGLEATRLIREKELDTQTRVPILAMTAHALDGDRERCLAAGMDGYVAKPIRAEELLRAISGLLANVKVS